MGYLLAKQSWQVPFSIWEIKWFYWFWKREILIILSMWYSYEVAEADMKMDNEFDNATVTQTSQ